MTAIDRRRLLQGFGAAMIMPRPALSALPAATIGFLTAQQPASIAPYLDSLRAGLAEEGYTDGDNLTVEYRYGEDDIGRVPDLARDLVAAGVRLIMAQGAAVPILSDLDLPVPIVYVVSVDPVFAGFARSLAEPIGNKTGLTFMAFECASKRLELMKEVMPGLARVTVIGNSDHPGSAMERALSQDTGRGLKLDVTFLATPTRPALDEALARIGDARPDAISVLTDGFAVQNRQTIIDFAQGLGIPVVSGWPVFAQSGALLTYGPRLSSSYRRLAYFVARILGGSRAQELPIERPSVFQTVVNLKAARSLSIDMPPALLARADEVIE